ncbi:hypothetical protein C4561_02950 [candidate division WWE3 bacterium]|jgi:hypothetical protein|uniref:ATP-grasp domain-containing protein n=1 Tax=candidate division WWE3 bacterium TaxID=2053526 RepID=A0A3A4ZK91_UNCKA|nr:MAG: hypothetical protein C4561_02950 [candidate division WWE3 bacterium]
MASILVVSVADDSHLPFVQQHLDEQMLIIDTFTFPETGKLTYVTRDGIVSVIYNGIDLSSVRSVWYRKPAFIKRAQYPVPEEYKEYAHNAYSSGVKLLFDLLADKFWVSPYQNHMRANNKVLQLAIAQRLGFCVPETIVTNDSTQIEDFQDRFPSIVAKPLKFTPLLSEDGNSIKAFYATSIAKGMPLNTSGLHLTPTIFQQEISPKLDIRITIVGNQVFACSTTPLGSMENKADWRTGITTGQVAYDPIELPEEISDKCVRYLRELGLPFGVIELARDAEGIYWFLELNPNGQWAFVEENTNIVISKAMAEMLSKGSI